ncbi:protein shisa-4-like [Nematolebias whitei]|uniref:protein shisa-4-like n=1 Tax=Nematolebias whitei TaxID=451745 RepID=UPI001899914E|nr:protein shisa-4-like [Nematolebias whitei]
MVSGFWSGVLCVFCLVVVQAVWADDCTSYWNANGYFSEAQQCVKYCCGDCRNKYCCKNKKDSLTEGEQQQCLTNSIGLIVGATLAVVIPVIICVALIICYVSPSCLIYKRCRKRRTQRQIAVTNTPQPPLSTSGHQPAYGDYQSVPVYEDPPIPSAPPPSYLEITEPAYSQIPEDQPSHPLSQPQSPPPYSDALEHLPFNPSYEPQL